MAQLIVRDLEESVKEGLRQRATRRRHSLEAEVRDILRAAVARPESNDGRLGSRIARRFTGLGRTPDFPELRGQAARPARLTS